MKYFVPQGAFSTTESLSLPSKTRSGEAEEFTSYDTKTMNIVTSMQEYFARDAEFLQLTSYSMRTVKAKQFEEFAGKIPNLQISLFIYLSVILPDDAHAKSLTLSSDNNNNAKEIAHQQHTAALESLLLAAECHLNPYFLSRIGSTSSTSVFASSSSGDNKIEEIIREISSSTSSSESNNKEVFYHTLNELEQKRDKQVLKLLIKAAKLERQSPGI